MWVVEDERWKQGRSPFDGCGPLSHGGLRRSSLCAKNQRHLLLKTKADLLVQQDVRK